MEVAHNMNLELEYVVVLRNLGISMRDPTPENMAEVTHDFPASGDISQAVNTIIKALPVQWLYMGYKRKMFSTHFAKPAASEK